MTIKQVLDGLGEKQRELLMSAFNSGTSSFIEYKPGRFIAVNLVHSVNMTIEQKVGRWTEGTLAGRTENPETDEKVS